MKFSLYDSPKFFSTRRWCIATAIWMAPLCVTKAWGCQVIDNHFGWEWNWNFGILLFKIYCGVSWLAGKKITCNKRQLQMCLWDVLYCLKLQGSMRSQVHSNLSVLFCFLFFNKLFLCWSKIVWIWIISKRETAFTVFVLNVISSNQFNVSFTCWNILSIPPSDNNSSMHHGENKWNQVWKCISLIDLTLDSRCWSQLYVTVLYCRFW